MTLQLTKVMKLMVVSVVIVQSSSVSYGLETDDFLFLPRLHGTGISFTDSECTFDTVRGYSENLVSFGERRAAGVLSQFLGPVLNCGYANELCEVVIPATYSACGMFREGLAPVAETSRLLGLIQPSKWKFINKSNTTVIPGPFDDARSFSQDRAPVLIDGAWGFINKSGEMTISPKYDLTGRFSKSLCPVRDASKDAWTFINLDGEVVMNQRFTDAGSFSDSTPALAPVKIVENGVERVGYIDDSGDFVIAPKYSSGSAFVNGKAVVREGDSVYYKLIDSSGKVLQDDSIVYADIHLFSGIIYLAKIDSDGIYTWYFNDKDFNIKYETSDPDARLLSVFENNDSMAFYYGCQ